ncbi:apolipoprotein B receptor isoform X2 [Pipistrellus kuhlii]|uniref:apolipoprotein B receptor isoform X2 n=1 Tax=Pipistrellus kuhlii TaxID=59472 RepID=UPI001E274499|nr:apolipoprotein B receptor isoform X2 [Pipistrellus kuhlii]
MDFLRLHLPGLHQALRGTLESFSTFVSYLLGDEVPTVERREAWAAEERGEVAPGRSVEEEAPEALEGVGGSQSKGGGGPRGPGEARRHQEGSSATEQTWSWGEGSSHGSQGDRQDTGAWEAAKASRCQEPSALLEARKKSDAGSETGSAQESQECNEQEVNREEIPRTWEQEEEEEEEEVRAREPGGVRGVESEWTGRMEPEGKAGAHGHRAAGDGRESEQAVKAVAEEIQGAGAKETGREEVVAEERDSQSTEAQGTQDPGAASEDGATLGREEVRTTSGREEAWTISGGEEGGTASDGEEAGTASGEEVADFPGVRETENGAAPGDRSLECTGRVWALEEASRGAQKEEVGGNREAEVSLSLKQTQALGEMAEVQTAGKESAEGQGSEWGTGEGSEGQADQDGKEAKGRQDSEITAAQAGLEEAAPAQEAEEEKESRWAPEAELSRDKGTNKAEGDADWEATPKATPEKELRERSEEGAQVGREEFGVEGGGPEHKVTDVWDVEQIGGPHTPEGPPGEGQQAKGELWSTPAQSKEEAGRSLEASPRPASSGRPDAEAGESRRKRDVQRGNSQEENVGMEEEEGEAAGGQESALPRALEAGGEWKEAGHGLDSQELGGRHGAELGTGWSLGESEARETNDEEVGAAGSWEAEGAPSRIWRLEEAAPSSWDSEDTQACSSAAGSVAQKAAADGRAAGTGEGPEGGAGEAWDGAFGRGWDSEGSEEAGRGAEVMEAAEGESRGGQELGLDGSSEEEVTGRGGQVEAFEAGESEPGREWAEAGDTVAAEGSCGVGGFTSGSQAVRAEGTPVIVEANGFPEGQMLSETEAGAWEARRQGRGSEGQHGDQGPEGEAQMPCDTDMEGSGHQRAEAKELDAEDLQDVQGQEDQPANRGPGPCEEAARGDVHGSWSEALLPVSRLDVSVPRSRVLLSRSSSQRRSRPSFRRIPTLEQQQEPASPPPPPEEELPAPEQRPLHPAEPPEPSLPRPEGTPVPARRRPLGQGFGFAHPGMMQELQARLGRPKPQ